MARATMKIVFGSPSVSPLLEDPAWTKLSARASNHLKQRTVQRAKSMYCLDLTTPQSATQISELSLSIAPAFGPACKQTSHSSLSIQYSSQRTQEREFLIPILKLYIST